MFQLSYNVTNIHPKIFILIWETLTKPTHPLFLPCHKVRFLLTFIEGFNVKGSAFFPLKMILSLRVLFSPKLSQIYE